MKLLPSRVINASGYSVISRLLFCLGLVTTLLVLMFAGHAIAKPQALQLDQTHSFLGKCQLTVSTTGIRIESKDRLGFVLVSKAPNWQVTVFRNDDKTYYTQSYKAFCESGMISGFIMKPTERIVGSPTRALTTKMLNMSVKSIVEENCSLKYLKQGVDYAEQAERIIHAAYKIPTNGGIPVYYVKRYDSKDLLTGVQSKYRSETILNTSKIQVVQCGDSIFNAPTGYKLAKSVLETITGDSTRSSDAAFTELLEMGRGGLKPAAK
jgi:hypothetical protein